MNSDQFERLQRSFESYHNMRVLPDTWVVLRVDGRAFHTLTQDMQHPFDDKFAVCMRTTSIELMRELAGVYAHTHSDEISVLLPPEYALFDRSVEKLVSISAAIASATFTAVSVRVALFDSRVVVLPTKQHVVDYFSWRLSDAARCALNGYAYWRLRDEGMNARQATKELDRASQSFMHDVLHRHDLNFAKLPAWQRNGTDFFRMSVERQGINPLDESTHVVNRSVIQFRDNEVAGDRYRTDLADYLNGLTV